MLTLHRAEEILCQYPAVRDRYEREAYPWPAGRGEPGVQVQSNVVSDPTARAALRGGASDGDAARLMAEYQRCFARMSLLELAAVEARLWDNLTWADAARRLDVTERRASLALSRAVVRFAMLWRWPARVRREAESPQRCAGGVAG